MKPSLLSSDEEAHDIGSNYEIDPESHPGLIRLMWDHTLIFS